MLEDIRMAALMELTLEDLELLRPFAGREPPFSGCTPEQKAALERYRVEYEVAALRIARPTTIETCPTR